MNQNGSMYENKIENLPIKKIYTFQHINTDPNIRLKNFAPDMELLQELVKAYKDLISYSCECANPERIQSVEFLEDYIKDQYVESQQLVFLGYEALDKYAQIFPEAKLNLPHHDFEQKCKAIANMLSSNVDFDPNSKWVTKCLNDDIEILTYQWSNIKCRWNLNQSICQEYLKEILLQDSLFMVSLEHIYIDDFIFTLNKNKYNEQLIRIAHI